MADRYWVGGTGNWSDATNHWATSSGGAPDAGNLPTASDSVFFDSSSNATAYTVTINTSAVCDDFTMAAPASGAVTWAGSSALAISGSMTLTGGGAGISRTYTGTITFNSTGAETITTNTETLAGTLIFNGVGGSWTFQDALTCAAVTFTAGTIDTNNQNWSLSAITATGTGTRVLTLGSSSVSLSGNWTFSGSNITINAGTSTLTFSAASPTFSGGGHTYYDVVFSGVTALTITGGSHSFHDLSITKNSTQTSSGTPTFPNDTTQTISGTLTLNGNSATVRLFCKASGQGRVFTLNAAAVALSNVDFQGCIATGAATWTGTSLGNAGANSGITFTTPVTRYWIGGTGNWSDTNEWSASSGGAGGASVPICHDTVVFDGNSFSAGSQTVTQDIPRLGASINWSAATNSPTWAFSASLASSIFGSLVLDSTVTITGSSAVLQFDGDGTNTLTSDGVTFTNDIRFQPVGSGTWSLADNLTTNRFLSVTGTGTFDANDFDISCERVLGPALTSTMMMGSGTWTITTTQNSPWSSISSSADFDAETSTIDMTGTLANDVFFSGNGKTFNNVIFSGDATVGTLFFQNSNVTINSFTFSGVGNMGINAAYTFGTFTMDTAGAHTITFSGSDIEFTNFNVRGSAGNIVTLESSSGGVQKTILQQYGLVDCDFLDISDIKVSGGARWFAGLNSTDSGGNNGWRFTTPAPRESSFSSLSSI